MNKPSKIRDRASAYQGFALRQPRGMHAPAHGGRVAPLWCVGSGIDVYVLNAWKSGFRLTEHSTFKHEIALIQASNHGQSA
ncbi:hypothetical protein XFF6166_520132 [Xanthomonas citri pv. fuscans]|nr:hypothetical protein XFF6166_520132 [Xanthomonas citri pv. fuscans]SOO01528.1 hypothetical protein XFF6960_480156 [Xanthomonas citri pv. fuscans]SOO03757.1 hypothetical protein XFF7767_180048 [Xanthomonas citri pv. fuscans]SOO10093.1 hypothetical protein XFF6970_490228 [Xanthomonas citri pv. fuscans]SOO14071.1 hypothetical protein XFF7766_260174 [Xanthomonas citri pv. fuscans]